MKLQAFSQISSLELDNCSSTLWSISATDLWTRRASFNYFLTKLTKLTSRLRILAISSSDSWRDSVVIISKVWTWILIISQVSDGIPAGKSAPLKPDKIS
ncbi:hypothetical protein RCL_jg4679.t1 [Rhizophagus clarus]|uniref:Uncharacterized protein n=1 Tax=Rhizophagus clarus TaxID=94130 RepID=A0A8H3L9J4_9GLOM|nr:hypothetical protein RCL_jg4679.t1 [Rhizophagus clarus]